MTDKLSGVLILSDTLDIEESHPLNPLKKS